MPSNKDHLREFMLLRSGQRGIKMGAIERQKSMLQLLSIRCRELLQMKGHLTEENLAYVMDKVANMRDERLKACIMELIGWGDEERAELESMVAILLEVASLATPSKFEQAAERVEIRHHITKAMKENQNGNA